MIKDKIIRYIGQYKIKLIKNDCFGYVNSIVYIKGNK